MSPFHTKDIPKIKVFSLSTLLCRARGSGGEVGAYCNNPANYLKTHSLCNTHSPSSNEDTGNFVLNAARLAHFLYNLNIFNLHLYIHIALAPTRVFFSDKDLRFQQYLQNTFFSHCTGADETFHLEFDALRALALKSHDPTLSHRERETQTDRHTHTHTHTHTHIHT